MPQWTLFGAVATVLTLAFVLLARASARALRAALDAHDDPDAPPQPALATLESDRLLAANVVTTHGPLLVALLVAAWFADVPDVAVGGAPVTRRTVGAGVALGVALAVGNEVSAGLAERLGLERDERLRTLLAPDTTAGWAWLLFVVLPLVAAAEELLFRGVLVGGFATGFGWPVWGLAVVSSGLFGLGHGLQGRAGVAVTAGLGFALAAAFVVTGSLAVVVVAHYVVNALEFVVHERPGAGTASTG